MPISPVSFLLIGEESGQSFVIQFNSILTLSKIANIFSILVW